MTMNYYINKYGNDPVKMSVRIAEIEAEYKAICDEIAADCEAEGYPSHGSNYELRASQEWKVMYSEEYDELCDAVAGLKPKEA